MSSADQLIEHFFRHEYGRLLAILTRALGVRHFEIAEDAVQTAMSKALQSWSAQGVPTSPSAWLYRTARNLAIDRLRRANQESQVDSSILDSSMMDVQTVANDSADLSDGAIENDALRFLFLCCHASIPLESQIALALKSVGGFGVQEIASGLLSTKANIEKRLARAKERLRAVGQELASLTVSDMQDRLDAVLLVIYLIFNEGYASLSSATGLRQELCDEAIRQARILVQHSVGDHPATRALLALMLMHYGRMEERLDDRRCIVLLADQDRSRWNWPMIREAMDWMLRAAEGKCLSRYHIEAAIAWEHCRASDLATTDWARVHNLYQRLLSMVPNPMIRLNAALAISHLNGPAIALQQLLAMSEEDRRKLRPWWDCSVAQMHWDLAEYSTARSHLRDALALAGNDAQRELIGRKLDSLPRLDD